MAVQLLLSWVMILGVSLNNISECYHLRVCFPGNCACNSEFENCDGIDTSAKVVWESGIWKEYNDNLGFIFFEFMWKWLALDCEFFVNFLLLDHQPQNSACYTVGIP